MKHRYTSLIASSALVLSLALTPLASFAATQSHDNEREGIFASIASWFHLGPKIALADTDTTQRNLPPTISGISSPTVLNAGATATWSVSASDPENGTLSYSVDWGDQGIGMRMLAALAPAFTQTSTFSHTYAAAGTYTITVTAKDDAGLSTTSTTTVAVTAAQTGPTVSGITSDAFTISGLDAGTHYHVIIESEDSTGAITGMNEFSLTTSM